MASKIDLVGETFGRLTVVKETTERKNKSIVWECVCQCGNICKKSSKDLRSSHSQSCGCLKLETDKLTKGNDKDISGKTFGRLTVIKRYGSSKYGECTWECACSCGNPDHIIVNGSNLRKGHTTSCGCIRASSGEIKISQILIDNKVEFQKEAKLFKFNSGCWASFDFFIDEKYIIEYDGETHFNHNLHGWHSLENLEKQQDRDKQKTEWCTKNNIPIIRIPYTDKENITIESLLPTVNNKYYINKEQIGNIQFTLQDVINNNLDTYKVPNVYSRKRRVEKYSIDGVYIETFNSEEEAAKSIGVKPYIIQRKCDLNIAYEGFQWKYEGSKKEIFPITDKNNIRTRIKVTPNKRKIIQLKDDNIVHIFNNKEELVQFGYTKEQVRGIIMVCENKKGNRKTSIGFQWKYGDEING